VHAFFAVRSFLQSNTNGEWSSPTRKLNHLKTLIFPTNWMTLLAVVLFTCSLPRPTEGAVTVIEGINFDENGANNDGSFLVPPSASGAAGVNHVVSVVQSSIEWHTKTGVQQNSQRLGKAKNITGSFFEPLSPANRLFGAKVIYDQYEDRFVVAALERQDTAYGNAVNGSRILLAVSESGNPNDAWHFQAITARLTISGLDRWADTLGLAIDEEAVYLSANMIAFGASGDFGGSRLWILDKGGYMRAALPPLLYMIPICL
jgi:hypothetical protein